MRIMRKIARICLIIENMDLDPLCSGSGRHSRVEAAISQPVFLSATSARCPIIPHRALDRGAAILPPLLSPFMFPSTLRAGPGRQKLYGQGGSAYNHDVRSAGPDNMSSAVNEGNPITLGSSIGSLGWTVCSGYHRDQRSELNPIV